MVRRNVPGIYVVFLISKAEQVCTRSQTFPVITKHSIIISLICIGHGVVNQDEIVLHSSGEITSLQVFQSITRRNPNSKGDLATNRNLHGNSPGAQCRWNILLGKSKRQSKSVSLPFTLFRIFVGWRNTTCNCLVLGLVRQIRICTNRVLQFFGNDLFDVCRFFTHSHVNSAYPSKHLQ